ncbi:hypothetical protein C1Y63_02830 [Corynebacterium sp. 13CS0277]|uniref:bifunctional nuclease domain-containing protein n=1 Tax=Corynebacterium sp. 13CS0277 TaxID=2071994 RepID=UPI000D045FA6|nr:bifunctional nuclease domain-containing protein [Corynebacterium sp. 13CS0277]PRQ12026.1 hypothetical protein C1Y63_02830 [Corynebacterium sp. 13CS0277]
MSELNDSASGQGSANAPEEVAYAGVHNVGPEGFACVMLVSTRRQVLFPLWVSLEAAAQVLTHESGGGHRRPDMVDVLKDFADQSGVDPLNVQITDYNKGVAYSYIAMAPDYLIDARPSDAIAFARAVGCPILITPSLLQQYGIPLDFFAGSVPFDFSAWVNPEELTRAVADHDSAVGDEAADASFADLMKNLGFDENELIAGMEDGFEELPDNPESDA